METRFSMATGVEQDFKKVKVTCMEDGGVDRTVIDCWQHQLGQMADFPSLLTILVFDI